MVNSSVASPVAARRPVALKLPAVRAFLYLPAVLTLPVAQSAPEVAAGRESGITEYRDLNFAVVMVSPPLQD
jgi:hypothetical protein